MDDKIQLIEYVTEHQSGDDYWALVDADPSMVVVVEILGAGEFKHAVFSRRALGVEWARRVDLPALVYAMRLDDPDYGERVAGEAN